ncbi:MAG TPA: amino acid adenylation domain-containing protein [Acidimicrobiales bacterium]|nr:amino acid adenylation domain-containing protein [Acidimicrobiales bacterium]
MTSTVADLLEAAAAAVPDATAVVADGRSLTYAELDARANRLAHHLQRLGVGPDVLVGVCIGRSPELAVALVAVLKAGGACVPLDPAYPRRRLAVMLDDARPLVVLTHAAAAGRLPAVATAPVIRVDSDGADNRDGGGWADRPATAPARRVDAGHLAYVIYTSGSTGRPKGVMLTHRGLVNHHRAVVDLYRLGPGDRVLQFCSLGFDASIEEMFPTWAAGGTVVHRPHDVPLLGRPWLDWLRRQGVTVLNLPTGYWHAWVADLAASGQTVPENVRLVVVGGEKALGGALRTWRKAGGGRARWVNAYGPTETTCMSTWFETAPIQGDDGERDEPDPPIGRPLPGTAVCVVDEGLRPVPDGVAGELLIGGDGLARGYLHDPVSTAERFVEGPDGRGGRQRMFRTGDIVRRARTGDLEYVGRIDDQVKIQGFRVECGEVEAALARHPDVAAATVVAREDPPGDRHLVAYVVARKGAAVDRVALRGFLGDRLPAAMVPAAFSLLDALPLTVNGKVDRAALPLPVGPDGAAASRSSARQRTPGEDRLAAIWARVLKVDADHLRPDDDFFALGGHSLLATQVIAQIREEFATETPLRAIFESPTLSGLAAAVAAERDNPVGGPPPLGPRRLPPEAGVPLSLAQEQMWALEAGASPPGLYNFTVLHRFDAPVDEATLRAAVAHLVRRHEVLRTRFRTEGEEPRQFVAPASEPDPQPEVAVVDLRGEPSERLEAELQRRIAEHEARPFDLMQSPLFRVALFHLDDHRCRLAVTFDHLISDGTGAAIFLRELVEVYEALVGGRLPALPRLAVQFADFAVWQRASVTPAVLRGQLDWLVSALDGAPFGPTVPFDHRPDVPSRRIARHGVVVDARTRAGLELVARGTSSTLFTVATAAAAVVFGGFGAGADVVMSTTISGRNRAELEGLVGMFSGVGRLRVDLSGDPPFAVVVARTRDWVLGMFEHQDIPFLDVRRAVLPHFPSDGRSVAAALPVEFQYFHGAEEQEFFFRGQLHPLSLTVVDDGTQLAGTLSYKLDFYDAPTIERLAAALEHVLRAVAADPSVRVSDLLVNRPGPA